MTHNDTTGQTHLTADGYPVVLNEWYWDNNLDLVKITAVADYSETNRNESSDLFGTVTWWHRTERNGRRDMSDGSRLAKRHPFTGAMSDAAATQEGR